MTTTPDNLLYSADHEWVEITPGGARIGVTDHAQDALGDVVYVAVPAIGTTVTKGDSMGEIESTKSVSDLFAPISGVVISVNTALADSPNLVNEDPYGAGWICEISPSVASDIDELLGAAQYTELIGQ
jgi:glycine cleavage system H protein